MSIKYEENSFAPHYSEKEIEEMKLFMSNDLENFDLDPEYAHHIKANNGGKPVNCYFKLAMGDRLPIDYFLNYSDTDLLTYEKFKMLNVNVVWSLIEDRLSIYLLPFAALPDGDFLCFDHSTSPRPAIVLWRHEYSEEDAPYTDKVSPNFTHFVQNLSDSLTSP